MFRTAFSLMFLFLVTLAGWAQNPKPKLPGEDWVSLFNGKDLSGWVKVGKEKWEVENGTIHGRGLPKSTAAPEQSTRIFICPCDSNARPKETAEYSSILTSNPAQRMSHRDFNL
jgi:hypothetical protein